MNFERYRNELIAGAAFLLMLAALLFRQVELGAQETEAKEMQNALMQMKEVVVLKTVWNPKNLSKKVKGLQNIAPSSKVKWTQKKKKVSASYSGLNVTELNRLLKMVLNLGVQIKTFEIKKENALYNVELTCKW